MRAIWLLPVILCLVSCVPVETPSRGTFKPQNGYVPDAETAKRIAKAVWIPIYGKEKIEREHPLVATLSNGVWTVKGSLPKGSQGGVAEIDIRKEDARILRVIHGQ